MSAEYREVEWAVECIHDNGTYATSSPFYRREHAERELKSWAPGSYVVRREIVAGPWRPWPWLTLAVSDGDD